ncbi:MAG: hypothetical protein ABJN26_07070 [Stappiaceae bacterium]
MSDTTFVPGLKKTGFRFDLSHAILLIVAGGLSTVAWEIWANLLAPLWIGGPLVPASLVKAALGVKSLELAQAIHFATGLILFPAGYLYVARPIANAITPWLSPTLLAATYGVALWVFAMYGMAHLVAGMPPFLNFIPLTWASLVGHVILGVVLGGVIEFGLKAAGSRFHS